MSSEGTRKALLTLLSERERLRKELARVEKAIAALESPIERTLGLREALEKALKIATFDPGMYEVVEIFLPDR